MANLKGGSFDKQVKDIHHRLSAFNQGRHGKDDHLTHSSALSDKRSEMSRSFATFCENKGLNGKLNEHMNNQIIKEFIDARTADMAISTQENYVRGFSSLVEGLKEANVDINVDKSVFNAKTQEIKENYKPEIETGRAISNVNERIENLYNRRYESGVIAEVQRELGIRVSEARELIINSDKYIKNDEVQGLVGKGNHEYQAKDISQELQAKINECKKDKIPSKSTYIRDLKEVGIPKTHDFRYTYVKENLGDMTKEELSKELNHNREEMTDRYIARL